MNQERIDYIFNFYESKVSEYPYSEEGLYIKVHAMLHCLTEDEIEDAYFTFGTFNKGFRSTLESFVSKRAAEKPGVAFVSVAQKLITRLKGESDYRKRLPVRTFLSRIISNMPKSMATEYFYILIQTGKSADRNKAYDVVNSIWSDDIKNKVVELCELYYDDKCLEIVTEKLTPDELIDIVKLEELWEEDVLYRRIKNSIIRKIYHKDLDDLSFLKEDVDSYLYLLSLKRESMNKEEFIQLIMQLPEEKKISKIWFLGLMKEWNSLVSII